MDGRISGLKTLIIPDVHQNIAKLKEILREPADRRVFLGDWFDDFGDTPAAARNTAAFLEDLMLDPANTFLYGNHDIPYAFPQSRRLLCSGFTLEKCRVLAPYMEKIRAKFILSIEVEGWLCSHAGFHPDYAQNIPAQCAAALKILRDDPTAAPFLLRAGWSRGGDQEWGGCTWLDWNDEFQPVPGIKQLVGHTQGHEVRQKGDNYCLDTRLSNFGIIEDGEFSWR